MESDAAVFIDELDDGTYFFAVSIDSDVVCSGTADTRDEALGKIQNTLESSSLPSMA